MNEFIDRIQSLTAAIGLLIVLHSIIGWYSFVELLWNTSEACDALGVKNCEYLEWVRLLFALIIETMIGFILLGFNLQDLNLNTSQERNTARQKSKGIPRELDEIGRDEESDRREKRCKFWGDLGRCKKYHTNARYCDEHMEIVSPRRKPDDLGDIFRLPGKD